ncbi:helix-turn-helix domain-containing protein [Streptomyces halobius]|uniref:Helix-turn-helix transcriptional regulator n=1 Tax=Streptomyces halobius TaxID=2879846 RepID=A0ABY4M8B0_9ACTN|nr:helix-turn-helix transcriptional regulator [Streptomyces halobius]UQA93573.1 helix-turn-helix transcriptional regulator [Streptomyces halobius]
MVPVGSPTLRQRRLGHELRKLRQQADLSATKAASQLGVNTANISMIESGRGAISAERVRTLVGIYSCADEELVDALAAMTGGRTRGWWDEYREHLPAALIDIAELEHHAVELRGALTMHIPALLQTLEHARSLFTQVVPPLRAYEIEHRLAYRIRRQGIIFGTDAKPYRTIIHEAALRMGFGGPDVARAQLHHLVDMSTQKNISVRVIPFGMDGFPGNGQSFDYALGAVRQLDTVQLDVHHGCEFLDSEAQLVKYRTILQRMEDCSLEPGKSRDFINHIAESI